MMANEVGLVSSYDCECMCLDAWAALDTLYIAQEQPTDGTVQPRSLLFREDVTCGPGLGARTLGTRLISYCITEECVGAGYNDNCWGVWMAMSRSAALLESWKPLLRSVT